MAAKKKAEAKKAPAKKKAAKKATADNLFNPYATLDDALTKMETKFDLDTMTIDKDEPRFSTGLLSLNLLLAGGLLGGGWYTFFGGEQSCKSTTAMTVLSSIMIQKEFIGQAAYFDYEGSSQAEYIENIMGYMGSKDNIERVFGVKDDDTGDWIVPARVRYYQPSNGEAFFNFMAKIEKELPDKVRLKDQWYYIYDGSKQELQKMAKQAAKAGVEYDKAYMKKHGKLKLPASDGSVQYILLCDSYPAMLPKRSEEKDEGDASLASQARMFSDGIKRVKSTMRKKRIVVLGVNQLRKVPMAMFGPTETEPCGEALRFFSDVRIRNTSVSLSTAGVKGKGALQTEESVVTDGEDTYRFIKVYSYKNKLGGIPNQSTILRLCVEDAEGTAKGFCRTWDLWKYLKMTGQVTGPMHKLAFPENFTYMDREGEVQTITLKHPLVGMKLNWMDFKVLVEGDRSDIKELCKAIGLKKAVMIRDFFEKQCSSGKGFALMKKYKLADNQGKRSKAKAKAAEVDDDDD